MIGVAGMLGGSLGLVVAGEKSLSAGFNLVGGPVGADIAPDDYVSCLPDGSWNAIYIWKADTQQWKHYFNTDQGAPAFVNDADAGGIVVVNRGTGVVILMEEDVPSAFLPDFQNDIGTCS